VLATTTAHLAMLVQELDKFAVLKHHTMQIYNSYCTNSETESWQEL